MVINYAPRVISYAPNIFIIQATGFYDETHCKVLWAVKEFSVYICVYLCM
jgi:hypothetical protein